MSRSPLHYLLTLVTWSSSYANGGAAAMPTVAHIGESGLDRPVHMKLAESWFRAYSSKTLRLVAPGPEHYEKAEKVCARMDAAIAESTIAPYFERDWWFTRDKVTKARAYSFGGWVAHLEEILAAGPVKAKAKGWACPKCGHHNTHQGATCMECHEEVRKGAVQGEEVGA